MNDEQLRKLSKMRKLINSGQRKFEDRPDRDYLADLLEIGINEETAWEEIIGLNRSHYNPDYRPSYLKTGDALLFKKYINGHLVYIKLKIEKYNNNELTVCISFHIDNKGDNDYEM